jgi:diguanylate cyclase (GGDEF)-like protein
MSAALWLLFGQRLEPSPFPLLCAAVALSTWYGGIRPGVLSVLLSSLAFLALTVLPAFDLAVNGERDGVQLAVFVLVTALIASLYAERHHQTRVLAQQALHDPLTGLPNRLLFLDRLEQLVMAARREPQEFAVLLVDLDGFKGVNDRLGHGVGDALLQRVALRLGRSVRESDTIARLGGDEFALLLPAMAGPGAARMVEKLETLLAHPFEVEGAEVQIGGSVGMAIYPGDGTDATLLRQADQTMYQRKRSAERCPLSLEEAAS